MPFRRLPAAKRPLACALIVLAATLRVSADGSPQTLPFSQNWANTGLITANDNWSGVPGIEGFRGDGLTAGTGTDPQTLLAADDPGVPDVNANQTNPNTFATGGVTEFELANPVVAVAGSGTASAPYLRLSLNTTNFTNIVVSYNLIDLETGVDNAVQPVALHFRVGSSGVFTNVPAAFVADATQGPSMGGLVTPVSVSLPASADNQPVVQLRIMTTNAVGNDEWVGVDDLQVTGTPLGTLTLSVSDAIVTEGDAGTVAATFTVSLSAPAPTDVTFDLASQDGSATVAGNDYVAFSRTGQVIPAGEQSATFDVTVNGDTTMEPNESFFLNATNVVGATVVDGQGQGTIVNDDIVPIHAIQGSGNSSPLAGQAVTTRGIVTGVKTNGFFIQTTDVEADADPNTSQGLFVFTSAAPPAAAAVGNEVRVSGVVQEFRPPSDLASPPTTELISPVVTLLRPGLALPAAQVLTAANTPPTGSIEQLERFEGMRVSVASLAVAAPTGRAFLDEVNATAPSNGVFYGVITGLARPFREPGIETPDLPPPGSPCCIPVFDANPERLRVDSDGQVGASALEVTSGATVTNLVGVLDYAFRTYTILPDPASPPVATGNGSAVPVPAPAADEFTVASWNLERFFNDVDDPGLTEPVLTPVAFANRLNKASLGIRDVLRTPDVLTVVEVENLAALQALASKVNADAVAAGDPNPLYEARLMEGNDPGGIDVGFLVKTSRVTIVDVTQVGLTATYINPNTGAPETLNDRPPLVLQATVAAPTGPPAPITVIANHLRSLIGVDSSVPQGSGTEGARVRAKRRAQAEFLANYIQGRQTADPNERIVSMGDYNAFQFNDGYVDSIGAIVGAPTPVDQVVLASPDLVNPDLTNLLGSLAATQRYSFSFDGNAQAIDHALVDRAALGLVSRVAYARLDSDFPESFRGVPTRPERLSDHDAAVGYFRFGLPSLSIGDASVTEGNSGAANATFTVTLSGASAGTVTVDYATADGTALAGSDYAASSGTLTFPPGATTQTLQVPVLGDTLFEPDQTFTVNLTNPTLAVVADGSGTGTIVNDESTPAISISDLSLAEGDAGTTSFSFVLTMSPPNEAPVTVGYATADGTAVAGADYVAGSGTASFASGQASTSVVVGVVGDSVDELDETFTVTLSNAVGATILDGTATGTIVNDDNPVISIADASLKEGVAGDFDDMEFIVTLNHPSLQTVTVTLQTADGTATSGQDYMGGTAGATFAPGSTSESIFVRILGDNQPEADEDFFANLSAPTEATIGDGQARGVILNDDGPHAFYSLPPCRVADTRLPADAPALRAGETRNFTAGGRCGVPADAVAVAIVLTTTGQTDFGDLRLYPARGTVPLASTINFRAGHARANNAIVPLGGLGAIAVRCDMPAGSSGITHFLFDVYGYFK